MAKLLETYAKRLQVAESVYAEEHNEPMSKDKKITVAACLNNCNRYLTEAFNNSVGTQRADIGHYKRFVLNLTNIALPNLIAFDLVMVKPMTARSGYVTYVEYVAGSNKGGVEQGDVFNTSLGFSGSFGKIDANRAAYTGATVVETVKENGKVDWMQGGKFGAFGKLTADEEPAFHEGYVLKAGAELLTAIADVVVGDKVSYVYDNIVIPQNDLPIINARTRDIPLVAKARRIAIYYSQMAAFEMKMEMGEDLDKNLNEQAVGELKFEIDNEIVFFLRDLAGAAQTELTFNRTLPVGLSKAQHYEGFLDVVEAAKQIIYDRTHRYAPSYLVCGSAVLRVLAFVPGFKASNAKNINGPYVAGNLNGLKVIVSPALTSEEFFFGVNEGMVSAAVYAPYMPIVPTQLLGYADGGMSQGFSTLYALAALNKDLVVAGKLTDAKQISYWADASSEA